MEDVPNTDHFDIIEKMVDGDYHLMKVHTAISQSILLPYGILLFKNVVDLEMGGFLMKVSTYSICITILKVQSWERTWEE